MIIWHIICMAHKFMLIMPALKADSFRKPMYNLCGEKNIDIFGVTYSIVSVQRGRFESQCFAARSNYCATSIVKICT